MSHPIRVSMDVLYALAPDGHPIEFDEHGNAFLTIGRQTWYAAAEVPAQVKR